MIPLPTRGWLASYDVSDDIRRAGLSRHLELIGHRVLLSGFVIPPFDDLTTLTLCRQLWTELEPSSDSLVASPWCSNCRLHLRGFRLDRPGEPEIL